MHITITDGYTLNPGDLSWAPFHELGEVHYYDRTQPAQILERCSQAEVIITNKTPLDAATIAKLPALKMIAVTATGYNVIDIAAARQRGIVVCNVPVYGTYSVAQHVFALILELTNHTGKNSTSVQNGDWARNPDWSYTVQPLMELSGKTMGIVGFGRIGRQVAIIAKAFGMHVIFFNKGKQSGQAVAVDLPELFSESDIISLHCPLTADNAGFVNQSLLSLMKPTAILVNTARGQLINEQDLADALQRRVLAAAALDVLSKEPPPASHPLLGLSNCLVTPHNAWISVEARKRLLQTTLENVQCFVKGMPQNRVDQ